MYEKKYGMTRNIWDSFFTLLVGYYEDESQKEILKRFLYDECLDGYKKGLSHEE